MEDNVEKVLYVIMAKVIEGIPNGQGGYLEQPLQSEAKRYLEIYGADLDQAVLHAAHDVLIKKRLWTTAIWKSALVLIVGQIPVVGSTAATTAWVCYHQFEYLWKQIRFISLAAAIYGHDVTDECTQLQIILCLLNDKVRTTDGTPAVNELMKNGAKGSLQVAANIVVRNTISSRPAKMFMKTFVGGLMSGVVMEAVLVLYDVAMKSNGDDDDKSHRVSCLVKRAQKHFKSEEQPSVLPLTIGLFVWGLPAILFHGPRIEGLVRQGLSLIIEKIMYPSYTAMAVAELSCVCIALLLLWLVSRWALLRKPWVIASYILGTQSVLRMLSSWNTTKSFLLAILNVMSNQTDEAIYHFHRAGVGTFLLATEGDNALRKYVPYIVGSLLFWPLFNTIWYSSAYLSGTYPWNEMEGTFVKIRDAVDAVRMIAMHIVILEIRKPDLVMSLFGPRRVVRGLLSAGKSVGHIVLSPRLALQWLETATPPNVLFWCLFAAQRTAVFIGVMWGIGIVSGRMTFTELSAVSYGVIATIPLVFWNHQLPKPHDNLQWHDVGKARHRLLYLIPNISSNVAAQLNSAIDFFETYDSILSISSKTLNITNEAPWQYERLTNWYLGFQNHNSKTQPISMEQILNDEVTISGEGASQSKTTLSKSEENTSSRGFFSWFRSDDKLADTDSKANVDKRWFSFRKDVNMPETQDAEVVKDPSKSWFSFGRKQVPVLEQEQHSKKTIEEADTKEPPDQISKAVSCDQVEASVAREIPEKRKSWFSLNSDSVTTPNNCDNEDSLDDGADSEKANNDNNNETAALATKEEPRSWFSFGRKQAVTASDPCSHVIEGLAKSENVSSCDKDTEKVVSIEQEVKEPSKSWYSFGFKQSTAVSQQDSSGDKSPNDTKSSDETSVCDQIKEPTRATPEVEEIKEPVVRGWFSFSRKQIPVSADSKSCENLDASTEIVASTTTEKTASDKCNHNDDETPSPCEEEICTVSDLNESVSVQDSESTFRKYVLSPARLHLGSIFSSKNVATDENSSSVPTDTVRSTCGVESLSQTNSTESQVIDTM